MGSFSFNKRLQWSDEFLIKLEALRLDYLVKEDRLGQQIQSIVHYTNTDKIEKNSDYIKRFYAHIMNPYRTKSYVPTRKSEGEQISQVEERGQKMVDTLMKATSPKDIASTIDWGAVGISQVLQTLKKEKSNIKYKLGDYTELDALQQMALYSKRLENQLNKLNTKSLFQFHVEDTEKYTGADLHKQWEYDIKVTMNKTDERTPWDQQIIEQYYEVKRGIEPSYLNSHFKLGDISHKGLSYPGNQTFYHDFIVAIQKDFKTFLNTKRVDSNNINQALFQLIQNIAYNYIKWRLGLHLLIFVSDTRDKINLGSEIIKGLMDSPGTYLDIVFEDLLAFIDISSITNNTRISGDMGDINLRYLEQWTGYDWEPRSGRHWIKWPFYDELEKYINSDKLLIPQFKATISYGSLQ